MSKNVFFEKVSVSFFLKVFNHILCLLSKRLLNCYTEESINISIESLQLLISYQLGLRFFVNQAVSDNSRPSD